MAEMQWARPIPAAARRQAALAPAVLRRFSARFLDREDLLTLVLALGAIIAVAGGLQGSGWSRDMPALTLVSVLAVVAALALARSRLPLLLAWPLGVLLGAAVTFWQTLEAAGPGTLEQRVDAVYARFHAWFEVAFGQGVSNDALPFNTLVLALTWLGVFLFGWSLFRWHNAWVGLIPGGIALFLDLVLVGDSLTGSVLAYVLFGSLLVMRTNLTARLAEWRAGAVAYPPLISLSFLHFSVWALLGLITVAWLAPVGPFATPAPVQAIIEGVQKTGVDFVRLAGPLHVKKVAPIHNYAAVLPFQGSIKLGDRELMAVTLSDTTIEGPLLLRGAVYDEYSSGGWKAGERAEVDLPGGMDERVREGLLNQQLDGLLVPLKVEMQAKSVVGTVVFTPGQPVASDLPLRVQVPPGSVRPWSLDVRQASRSRDLSDAEIFDRYLPDDLIGVSVERDERGRVSSAQVFDTTEQPLPDSLVLDPGGRVRQGQSYNILGFVPRADPGKLRQAGEAYPTWVVAQYLQLPDSVPLRVGVLAQQITRGAANPYDTAKALEAYLRAYPVDYKVEETPPGRDAVDYFLFDARRGYFDYHASAMVVMLRALGVPARLGVGFVADQSDLSRDSGAYVVRDRNSYTWPEVYFPGDGWIPFNPTPDRPADLTPQRREAAATLSGTPTLEDFPDLPISAADRFNLTGGDQATTSGGGSSRQTDGGYLPWALVAAAGFALAVAVAARTGWQRSVAGLPLSQQLWEKTVRLASLAGQPPQPGQTPREYAESLHKRLGIIPDVRGLAAYYSRSRFGRGLPGDDPEERADLQEAWPRLRRALVGAIAGRLLRRR
ncbi:MAG: transglutaminase domain-containing protein [Dehalococcoidia bacterium]|nr:transglutaminase domain-containing protein [Dehalococcoidia bacterium]